MDLNETPLLFRLCSELKLTLGFAFRLKLSSVRVATTLLPPRTWAVASEAQGPVHGGSYHWGM